MAQGLVKINGERCKGCELCVAACPKGLIRIDEAATNGKGYHPACVTDRKACIGCANCALMCPDGALSVYQEEKGRNGNA